MSEVIETLPDIVAEPIILRPEPAPRVAVHEFWTRGGEVKDLRREVVRLKLAAANVGV